MLFNSKLLVNLIRQPIHQTTGLLDPLCTPLSKHEVSSWPRNSIEEADAAASVVGNARGHYTPSFRVEH